MRRSNIPQIGFETHRYISESYLNAIGVIMGSNIGTTLTAWIVAFSGFKFKIGVFGSEKDRIHADFLSELSREGQFNGPFSILYI